MNIWRTIMRKMHWISVKLPVAFAFSLFPQHHTNRMWYVVSQCVTYHVGRNTMYKHQLMKCAAYLISPFWVPTSWLLLNNYHSLVLTFRWVLLMLWKYSMHIFRTVDVISTYCVCLSVRYPTLSLAINWHNHWVGVTDGNCVWSFLCRVSNSIRWILFHFIFCVFLHWQ